MALIRWLFNIQHVPKPKKNKDGSKKLLVQSNESQAKSAVAEISRTARKIIQQLVQKAGPVIAKSYSVSKDKIMVVLKKKSPVKNTPQELTSTDLDVEKWLESLNTSTKKKSIASGNTTLNTDKKKK
jgi:hypothetical protein